MRRLTLRRRDRGAAATWVALLIVPLLVVGALGIDVGLMQVDRQRLQTGADAAALAIATQCSRQICTGPTNALAAQDMATANAPLVDPAYATVDVLDRTEGYVEVTTTSTRDHFFGPVAGIDSTQLSATAGARWGFPVRGTVDPPLAISWCALAAAVGTSVVRDLSGRIVGVDLPTNGLTSRLTSVGASVTVCPSAVFSSLGLSGLIQNLPFGFLATRGCGNTVVAINTWVSQAPQQNPPTACRPPDFAQYVGQTIYLPVYSAIRTSRTSELYIYAFVAVTINGYNFGPGMASPNNPCPEASPLLPRRCLDLTFQLDLSIDSPSDDFEYGPGGQPIGDPRVQLVLPEERP